MNDTPLRLLSSMAARQWLAELAAQYSRDTGITIAAEAIGGVAAAQRVARGAPVDVVVLARDAIDRLTGSSQVRAGSATDLVRSGIAVAIPAGAPRLRIDDEAAVRAAVLAVGSLAYSTGPSGAYLEQLFARWGLLEQIRPRIVIPPPGVPVATLVASGECALGFQQHSELLNQPGITVLGPLPSAIQQFTTFSGAVTANSRCPERAAAFLGYLAAATHDSARRRHGFAVAAGGA